ncbi:MAG: sigma-E factor negative regulatory protein RseB [Lentisphaeria bacterium]|jgi:sigma-E factor negative regulatory protein RseB
MSDACGRLVCLSFLLFTSYVFALPPEPPATEVLTKMAKAIRLLDYRGRLTYEHSGKIDVIEISHGVIGGLEYEKVSYLNGPDRSRSKSGNSSNCISPGSRLLSGGFLTMPNGSHSSIDQSYSFVFVGEDRIAGRDAWVIRLQPKDDYRYSVVLGVDKTTYLPLKSLLIANGRNVLERLHFISLETEPSLNAASFDFPSEEGSGVGSKGPCTGQSRSLDLESYWQPTWVPPGFVLSEYSYSEEDGHVETYTDGIATFSVFVAPTSIDGADFSDSSASFLAIPTSLKRGATVIVMAPVSTADSRFGVSVVGEIPGATASKILTTVALVTAPLRVKSASEDAPPTKAN